ncbi:Energy-coupling factor transporter transmembrane protein EcfT [archaeon HR01]|nr:Energy-coupling factor transporter transmembrane protein EcfT [archaeon HR01]
MAYDIIGYRPLNTFMHRRDPRVKILWFLALSLPAVAWNDPLWLLGVLAVVLVFNGVAKMPFRGALKILILLTPAMFVILLFNIFFFEQTVTASRPPWPLFYLGYVIPKIESFGPYGYVSLESLIFASGAMMRFFIITLAGRVLLSTTSPSEIPATLTKLRAPVEMAVAVSVAFGMVPAMIQQVTSIFEAQRSRGWSVSSRNPLKALKRFVPTVLPIISRSISRSEFIAAAMASRGYGYNPSKRTSLKELKLTRTDWILIVLLVTFLVLNQLSAFVFKMGDYRATAAMVRAALGIPT